MIPRQAALREEFPAIDRARRAASSRLRKAQRAKQDDQSKRRQPWKGTLRSGSGSVSKARARKQVRPKVSSRAAPDAK